ncbi:hypothetical protein ACH40E_38045 [Streptomyces acidicola]|uniref:hypothetical protein n=1 Tax=Streptomyces acidicola TaxID=2596892 RepID=UPI00378EBD15
MRRLQPGDNPSKLLPNPWWKGELDPKDAEQATRIHEAAHAVAFETLWIPVTSVEAGLPEGTKYLGQEIQGRVEWTRGHPQVVAVAGLIGSEAETRALQEMGYDDPGLLENAWWIGGSGDRAYLNRLIDEGHVIDAHQAQEDAIAMLQEEPIDQAVRGVAEALEHRGGRLTGYELRQFTRELPLERGIWVPEGFRPDTSLRRQAQADDFAEDARRAAQEQAREPPAPAEPPVLDLVPADDFDIDI